METAINDFDEAISIIFSLHLEATGMRSLSRTELGEYAERLGFSEIETACIEEAWAHRYNPGAF